MRPLTHLLSSLCLLAAGTAFAQAPSEFEMELWRSATRLDTPAAYEAYLKAFPQGAFAAMAKAALGRPGAAPPAAPATAVAPAPAVLAPFTGPVNSGASDLPLGARLVGPGVITVGSLGNRRQLIVPAGEWILLAAEDHNTKAAAPVAMSSMAFGQFSGPQLRSLLVFTFNRRQVTPQTGNPGSNMASGMLPTWRLAQRCENAAPAHGLPETVTSRWLRRCALVQGAGDWQRAFPEAPTIVEPIDAAMQALKGEWPRFALRSEVHLTDIKFGYEGVTRLDAAAVGGAAERAAWLKRYAELAEKGYTREFESNDLVPGTPNPTKEFALPF